MRSEVGMLAPPRIYPRVKRAADLLLALAGLVAASPVFLLIMAATWLDSGRPLFFLQERSGLRGRVFTAYKFRTMHRTSQGPHLVSDIAEDPRVTRVGRLLRGTAMDELPILLNILKGEMSFVGPKALYPRVEWPGSPEHGKAIDEIPGFAQRSQVRPGLTGLSQIYASRDVTYEEKFRFDAEYIRRMSPWLDLKLFALSWWVTLRAKWESPRGAGSGR